MRLSCLPVSCYEDILSGRMSLTSWVELAASLGLDGVDFSSLFFGAGSATVVDRLREETRNAGLQACMLACYPDFTHPDVNERLRQVEEMRANVRVAARLGASLVRVTAGQRHPGVSRDEGVDWAVGGLQQVLSEADRLRITLTYENHTKGALWQYWDFSQASDVFLEILSRLAHTSLGVNFDTANCLVGHEDPVVLLEQVKDRVVSVHAADIRALGSLEPVVIGTGVVPFHRLFSILKTTGFDGWICIEEASRTGFRGFEEAVSFVRDAWKKA